MIARLIPALVVVATLATTPAFAADFSARIDALKEDKPAFTTMGIGSLTCAKFAEYYRDSPNAFESGLLDWAQGYWSATNAAARHFAAQPEKKLNAWTVDQQRDALRSYCDRHPLGRAVDGVVDIYKDLPDAHPPEGE